MTLVLQPQPRFKLGLLQHFFSVTYAFSKHHCISMLPQAPNNSCPYPFPDQILYLTTTYQMEALKVYRNVIVLNRQNAYPFMAHGPHPPCMFTIHEKMLAGLLRRQTQCTHGRVHDNPPTSQTHSCRDSPQQYPPGQKQNIRKSFHLPEEGKHLFLWNPFRL